MAHDFCPTTIQLDDGTECELYETFTDRYLLGLIAVEVCNYRCGEGIVHSRWRLVVFGIPSSHVGGDSFDPHNPPPLPPNHPCPDTYEQGAARCTLAAVWGLSFLFGIMKVTLCIYSCGGDRYFYSRWRTSFFGIPLPWRGRFTFPYPI